MDKITKIITSDDVLNAIDKQHLVVRKIPVEVTTAILLNNYEIVKDGDIVQDVPNYSDYYNKMPDVAWEKFKNKRKDDKFISFSDNPRAMIRKVRVVTKKTSEKLAGKYLCVQKITTDATVNFNIAHEGVFIGDTLLDAVQKFIDSLNK